MKKNLIWGIPPATLLGLIIIILIIGPNIIASMSVDPNDDPPNNDSNKNIDPEITNELCEKTVLPFNFNRGINAHISNDLFWGSAIGDLDNDGDMDIVGAYGFTGWGSIKCFENDGTPWEEWPETVIGTDPGYHALLAVVDLNNDNYPDVVSTYYSTFSVYLSNGTPWQDWDKPFEFPPITDDTFDSEITDLEAKDIDGDTRIDIVSVMDNEIFVWHNLDRSGLNYSKHRIAYLEPDSDNYRFDSQIRAISIDDMDNDGDLDVITVSKFSDEFSYYVKFWENDGSPLDDDLWNDYTIQTVDSRQLSFGYITTKVVIPDVETVDMDGNGYKDVISGDVYGNIIVWFSEGNLKTKISGTYICRMTQDSYAITCGDLDHDKDIDIVSMNNYGDLIAIENPGKNYNTAEWPQMDLGEAGGAHYMDIHLVDIDYDSNPDIIAGYSILIWKNMYGINKYFRNYQHIYSYKGTAPTIDGKITSIDAWDETPVSISTFDDGDVNIRSKHDGENLYLVIQWSDHEKIDDHFDVYFEDDGKKPDHNFDTQNEDFKYGWLEPDGDEISYRDGCWNDGWPIDGGYDKPEKNICHLGSYWSDSEWVLEIGFPLNNDDYRDINVTGNEILGFLFQKNSEGNFDLSPSTAEKKDAGSWAELHIEFSDGDSDNDGCFDCCDDFPNDSTEWNDFDNDGKGDNSDNDDDNDGSEDTKDKFPHDPDESKDTDGDGYGDNIDEFPEDNNEWFDTDGDGIGNNNDKFPYNDKEWQDSDGDGIGDNSDDFPKDPKEWSDFDSDGVGDNTDLDDDADGYPDVIEISEGSIIMDKTSTPADLDKDLDPDSTDPDIDGDGIKNIDDEFPRDHTRWTSKTEIIDFDNDDLPDSWEMKYFETLEFGPDNDNDNDGFTNKEEYDAKTNPVETTSDLKNINEGKNIFENYAILIIIVVIIIIIILLVFAIIKKRRSQDDSGTDQNQVKYPSYPPGTGQEQLLLPQTLSSSYGSNQTNNTSIKQQQPTNLSMAQQYAQNLQYQQQQIQQQDLTQTYPQQRYDQSYYQSSIPQAPTYRYQTPQEYEYQTPQTLNYPQIQQQTNLNPNYNQPSNVNNVCSNCGYPLKFDPLANNFYCELCQRTN